MPTKLKAFQAVEEDKHMQQQNMREESKQGQRESENTNRRVIGNGTEPKQDPN